MKNYRIIAIVLLLIFVLLFVLKTFIPGEPKTIAKPAIPATQAAEVAPPDFNADSAFAFVKAQTEFGPRVPNSTAHQKCGDWLVSEFKRFGASVVEQKTLVNAYDGKSLNMRNIIASFNPGAKKRVMLAAHWDSRPFADKDEAETNWKKAIDGANDGASGVGVLLEIARQLSAHPITDLGVDLALWDAEDYGQPEFDETENPNSYLFWCLGSQHWVENKHVGSYSALYGILLDMVGAPDAQFHREGYSMAAAGDVVNKVWAAASKLGYGSYFQDDVTGEIVDDHIFMNRGGVRTIDIIDMRPKASPSAAEGDVYSFGNYHHTVKDNIENIDPKTLKAVGQTVLYTIYNTAH